MTRWFRNRLACRAEDGRSVGWVAWLGSLAIVGLLALSGCGSPGLPSGSVSAVAPTTAQPPGPGDGIDDFATRYGLAAEAAAREGRWTDAIHAWDVLRALRPDDAGLLRLREHAQRSGAAAGAAQLQQARVAQRRGDSETAFKLYLQVLAWEPDNVEVADNLRTLERDRNRRVQRNRATRSAAAQRSTVDAGPGSAAATIGVGTAATGRSVAAGGGRNEIEHANLLADQGELDGAIAVLTPVVGGRRTDPAARTLLADLYFRKAEQLQTRDRPEAVKALERSLSVDPGQARAAKLLRELRTP